MTGLIRTLAAAATALALHASPALAHDRPAPPPPAYAPPPASYVPRAAPLSPARRELVRDYRRLEAARDRFYASWGGNRHEQRRFERWYAERRERLDRRWAALGAFARYEPRRFAHERCDD